MQTPLICDLKYSACHTCCTFSSKVYSFVFKRCVLYQDRWTEFRIHIYYIVLLFMQEFYY